MIRQAETRRFSRDPIRATGIMLAGAALGAASTFASTTLAAFRPSRTERRQSMPGDTVVPDAAYTTTQAVTIAVPPDRVWPWLVQMGGGRAGWYSYDRIDNAGRPSARSILPEHQQLAPGDLVPGLPDAADGFTVHSVDAPHDLILVGPAVDPCMSWEFLLGSLPGNRTRLVVRVRVSTRWRTLPVARGTSGEPVAAIERVYGLLASLPTFLLFPVAGFGHRIMQNRQLRGIRERAEAYG